MGNREAANATTVVVGGGRTDGWKGWTTKGLSGEQFK